MSARSERRRVRDQSTVLGFMHTNGSEGAWASDVLDATGMRPDRFDAAAGELFDHGHLDAHVFLDGRVKYYLADSVALAFQRSAHTVNAQAEANVAVEISDSLSLDRVGVLTSALNEMLDEFRTVDKLLAAERGVPEYKPDPIIAKTEAVLAATNLLNRRADGERNCHMCAECVDEDGRVVQGMILCPSCGNKRCPKASDHVHPCTGSNERGQPGSRYQ